MSARETARGRAGDHCVVQFVDPLMYPPLFDPNVVQFVVVGAGGAGWGCGGGAETVARKLVPVRHPMAT